jgi:hypothetical protein
MAADISTPEVIIDLSGETFTLTPTLTAVTGINAAFGGLYPAGQRAMAGDIQAIATIIRFGAGLKIKDESELVSKVFRAGVTSSATKAMTFVGILINGGKMPKEAGEQDGETGEAAPSGQGQG